MGKWQKKKATIYSLMALHSLSHILLLASALIAIARAFKPPILTSIKPFSSPTSSLHVSGSASAIIPDVYKKQTKFRVEQTIDTSKVSSVYVRHCLMLSLEAAEEVVEEIRRRGSMASLTTTPDVSSDPFGEVAGTLSSCEGTRPKGGDVGWLDRGAATVDDSVFPEEARRALFEGGYRLKPGVSDGAS